MTNHSMIHTKKRKTRAKTATQKFPKNNTITGMKPKRQNSVQQQQDTFTSNLVCMNDKQMNIAKDATAKGIVSLYNKGFVPKKTGKVSKKSQFALTSKTPLYSVPEDDKYQYSVNN